MSKKTKYYDGPYIDSGLTLEERIKRAEEALEESKNLTEWEELD